MKTFTREQITPAFETLPKVTQDILFTPEIEHGVQKIGLEAGLLIDQLKNLNTIVNYAILGLLSEEELVMECKQIFNLDESVSKKLIESISREILLPNKEMRDKALLIEKEAEKIALEEKGEQAPPQTAQEPAKVWEKAPDVAPDNLPIAEEGEPPLPQITPTFGRMETEGTATHPFEEKLKKVFTAGQQSMGELTIEPTATQETTAPDAPRIYHADPYRETIE